MRTYVVTLVLFPGDEQKTVTVTATSAVDACSRAEHLNPGSIASGANIINASA